MSRNPRIAELERALAEARAEEFAAQRVKRARVERDRGSWLRKQKEAAAQDLDHVKTELIVIRTDPRGAGIGRVIVWDILCDTQPKRSRLGEVSRRKADDYARELRAMGHAVRVVQG